MDLIKAHVCNLIRRYDWRRNNMGNPEELTTHKVYDMLERHKDIKMFIRDAEHKTEMVCYVGPNITGFLKQEEKITNLINNIHNMKRTTIIIATMMLSLFASAQHTKKIKQPKFDWHTATQQQIAAHELKVCNNTYLIGLGCAVTGATVTIWDMPKKRVYYTCGLLTMSLGGILMIESHVHIGRAGKALNGQKIYYSAGSNGIGMTYRF